jgi:hypothetical protein
LVQFTLKTSVAGPFSRQKKNGLGPIFYCIGIMEKNKCHNVLGKTPQHTDLNGFFCKNPKGNRGKRVISIIDC